MKTPFYLLSFVIAWMGSIFCQDTSKILLQFNEPMSRSTLFLIANYEISDQAGNLYQAVKIGVAPGDTMVIVYVTPLLPYRTGFVIRVSGLKDAADNLIDPLHDRAEFYFNGFVPGVKTSVNIQRE